MVAEKYRLILFGRYPFEEQWRPLIATLLMFGLVVAALLAALMSTLDTYINAVAAIGVNDQHSRGRQRFNRGATSVASLGAVLSEKRNVNEQAARAVACFAMSSG